MPLKRWFLLIALCVGCGMVQVAWRNAIIAKSYQLGERMSRLERSQADVDWLTTEVVGLESPVHLAQISEERHLELVAWSALPEEETTADRLVRLVAEDEVTD